MTAREWCLLEEGATDAIKFQERRIAKWLSPLLSATAGQAITPAQLLGESEPADTKSVSASKDTAADRAAHRRYKAMMRKIAKREKGQQCPAS